MSQKDRSEAVEEVPFWQRRHLGKEEVSRLYRRGDSDYDAALRRVMGEHLLWLQTEGREGTRLRIAETDLSGATLWRTKLVGAEMNQSDFSRAQLDATRFHGARMSAADFTKADLVGAVFPEAKMSYRGLVDSKIRGASVHKRGPGGSQDR